MSYSNDNIKITVFTMETSYLSHLCYWYEDPPSIEFDDYKNTLKISKKQKTQSNKKSL